MTRARLLAALAVLVVLSTTSGCVSLFDGGPDEGALNERPEEPYDWNTTADATVDVRKHDYRAVYNVSDRREIALYTRNALGMESPLSVSKLRFRYPTDHPDAPPDRVVSVANDSAFNVSQSRNDLVVALPARGGQLAYTTPKQGTTVGMPVYIDDREQPPSYEMILPPGTDVAVPLLAKVQPGGFTTSDVDGRVHVFWEEVTAGTVSVRFYLDRDLYIFGGMVGLLALVGVAGAAYYLLQIRQLVKRREEVGLDVDVGDDSGDGPPPGM